MEDLWNDITLSSLHHPSPAPNPHHNRHHFRPNFTTAIFQDFLARPFKPNIASVPASVTTGSLQHVPQTLLSLTTTDPPELQLGADSSSGYSPPSQLPGCPPFESLTQFGKRPLQESESDEMHHLSNSSHHCSSDRRNKRMIKNRESAARSRARKQAYTNELELEVAQLKQENARLRMEQEMRNRAVLDQSPKKHRLYRTSTAPF